MFKLILIYFVYKKTKRHIKNRLFSKIEIQFPNQFILWNDLDMAVVPKFASTVILLRKCQNQAEDSNFEILMVKRSENMRFMGGFHAFPGGKLEKQDYLEANLKRCKDFDKEYAYNVLQDDRTSFKEKNIALGFWIAAIREVFEELGILLAYQDNHLVEISSEQRINRFQKYREKLIKDQLTIFEILEKEDLFFAVDQLHYFRHFITPPFSPIRYDARFFLAKLPERQRVTPYSKEIVDFEYLTPKGALGKYKKKEIKIIAPQYACLRALMNEENIKFLKKRP